MRRFWPSFFSPSPDRVEDPILKIHQLRTRFEREPGEADDLPATIALAAVHAERELGQRMFDAQLRCALALAHGKIAEMPTGEGKTLAAVPAIAWLARQRKGVHVMTANDYLARRDAEWMRGLYARLGLTVSCVQQGMSQAQRREAYAADVTYGAATEIGFDFLRGQIALTPEEQVQRPFHAAVMDEADSILIDEARIPLVIAAGSQDVSLLAHTANEVVRGLARGVHYFTDDAHRHVNLTDAGIRVAERAFGCGNLFEHLGIFTAVQDALHAHVLLRRDVDYLVKDGAIETIDEHKGRVAQDRRFPAGLHAAIEWKEDVTPRPQGAVLASITVENLVALYPHLCGMTGTAATQAEELREIYGLEVEVIPPHRAIVRIDHPDLLFPTKWDKLQALVAAIRGYQQQGRPVLVGTASVEESEQLSALLHPTPHAVLNARDDEAEAATIAQAGERGAVTISTNMAGRGVDIRLGEGVAAAGGLVVLGTNKHASQRIDNQLRGRAGRQGDPGESRFFVSLDDDLLVQHRDVHPQAAHDPASMQRIVEGQHLDLRLMLSKYEQVIEGQRQRIQALRQPLLEQGERARLLDLDDAWSAHLAAVADLRSGVQWLSLGGRPPLGEYLQTVDAWYRELEAALENPPEETAGTQCYERGAVWTYLTSDQPFGSMSERIMKGLVRKARERSFWA